MKANQRRAAQQPSVFSAPCGPVVYPPVAFWGAPGRTPAIDDEGGGSSSSSSSSSSSVAGDAAAARLGVAVLAQPPLRGCPRAMDVVGAAAPAATTTIQDFEWGLRLRIPVRRQHA